MMRATLVYTKMRQPSLNNRFNFTEKALAALPVPTDKKPVTYYDDGQADFVLL